MSWWNPFKKEEKQAGTATQEAPAGVPALPKELAESPEAKGMMAAFYRKWKDPAFLKQLRVLASHMQREGVNVKDMSAVKAWLEKHKDDLESGKFKDEPQPGQKQEMVVKSGPDVGRNDPCPCGSGKKYKKCCGAKS